MMEEKLTAFHIAQKRSEQDHRGETIYNQGDWLKLKTTHTFYRSPNLHPWYVVVTT